MSTRTPPPDLYGSPWQPPEEREERRRKRHAYWRSLLTARDRRRISALIKVAARDEPVTRIDDLDAPGIAVGACLAGWETRYNGEVLSEVDVGGVKVMVLVWRKG